MGVSRWVVGAVLLVACDKRETAPTEPPAAIHATRSTPDAAPPPLERYADNSAVQDALEDQTSSLQRCYVEGLEGGAQIYGKVGYSLLILSSGGVESVHLDVDAAANLPVAVTDCTADEIRAWTFPVHAATESPEITFDVVFSRAESSEPEPDPNRAPASTDSDSEAQPPNRP